MALKYQGLMWCGHPFSQRTKAGGGKRAGGGKGVAKFERGH